MPESYPYCSAYYEQPTTLLLNVSAHETLPTPAFSTKHHHDFQCSGDMPIDVRYGTVGRCWGLDGQGFSVGIFWNQQPCGGQLTLFKFHSSERMLCC